MRPEAVLTTSLVLLFIASVSAEPGFAQTAQSATNRAGIFPDPSNSIDTPRPHRPWSRVRIPDPHIALMVRRVLDEVALLLGDSRCQRVLKEFRDRNGRPLEQRLTTLGLDVDGYLDVVLFLDGTGYAHCGDTLAFTEPGSRVVHICARAFEREWRHRRRPLPAKLIHEVLHTLGLGENPPSSAEITDRVIRLCGGNQKKGKTEDVRRYQVGTFSHPRNGPTSSR